MGWNFLPTDVCCPKLQPNGQTRKELTGFACCRDILPSRSIGLAGATGLRRLASAIPPHPSIYQYRGRRPGRQKMIHLVHHPSLNS